MLDENPIVLKALADLKNTDPNSITCGCGHKTVILEALLDIETPKRAYNKPKVTRIDDLIKSLYQLKQERGNIALDRKNLAALL